MRNDRFLDVPDFILHLYHSLSQPTWGVGKEKEGGKKEGKEKGRARGKEGGRKRKRNSLF